MNLKEGYFFIEYFFPSKFNFIYLRRNGFLTVNLPLKIIGNRVKIPDSTRCCKLFKGFKHSCHYFIQGEMGRRLKLE